MVQNENAACDVRTAGAGSSAKRIRWWQPWLLVTTYIVAVVTILGLMGWPESQRISQLLNVSMAAGLLLATWFLLTRELAIRTRLFGVTASAFVVLFPRLITCTDGYLGDATPRLTWRWAWTVAAPHPRQSAPGREVLTTSIADSRLAAAEYPGFMNRQRNASLPHTELATDWDTVPPVELWRRAVGPGWSAFAVSGNNACTQEQRSEGEATVCYDLLTGRERWVSAERSEHFSEHYGGDGPRATPAIDRNQVFSLGATGVLNCLDLNTGASVWKRNIIEDSDAKLLMWGMSGSPLVHDNLVVVNAGGNHGHSMMAYDRHTGDVAWHAGDSQASYSSPLQVDLCGVSQVVMLNGTGLEGYHAKSGERLWNFPWQVNGATMCSISQPVVCSSEHGSDLNRIFITGGYGAGCVLVDVSRSPEGMAASEVWPASKVLKSKLSNVVIRDTTAWGLDEGIMVSVDLPTGRRNWKRGRYGHGQLLMTGNAIMVQAESGDVVLVEASASRHRELSRFSPLTSKTWNHPVLAGNLLLVRNDREAACFVLELTGATGESPMLTRVDR